MSAVAHVESNFARMGVDIFIGTEGPEFFEQIHGDDTRTIFRRDDAVTPERRPSLTLREDHARALLAGLLRYYQGGDDVRELRRDYNAERARVDKLTDALIALPLARVVTAERVAP